MGPTSGVSGCRLLGRLKTLPAKYRSALCWFERHRCLLATTGAIGASFYLLVTVLLQAQRLCALSFACLATFGFVLELLVMEKHLLAGGEHEIITAIDTFQDSVLELHREAPLSALVPKGRLRAYGNPPGSAQYQNNYGSTTKSMIAGTSAELTVSGLSSKKQKAAILVAAYITR